jgi:aldose 1-epimerase
MLPDLLTLTAGALRLRLCPQLGGSVVDLLRDGVSVFRPLADGALAQRNVRLLGCYPLLPYSNRIAQGRFTWGRDWQLDHNSPGHPHTIHGVGWQGRWRVEDVGPDQACLALDYDPEDAGLFTWPFRLHGTLTYALDPAGLSVTVAVRNEDAKAWPAGIGLHPYFPRPPDLQLGFRAERVWAVTEDHLPGDPGPVPTAWRFDPPRTVDGPPLDNCFGGWDGRATLRLPALGHTVEVLAEPAFGCAMVYAPERADFFAFEPISHPPDAINRGNEGLRLLGPGESLSGTVRFAVTQASR